MTLEEKLVALRKEKKLSQLELSEALKISRQAISRWEVGDAIPSIDNLRILSDLYDVSIDYLLSDNEYREKVHTDENTSCSKKRKKLIFISLLSVLLAVILIFVGIAIAYQNKKSSEVPISEMETEEDAINFSGDFSVNW